MTTLAIVNKKERSTKKWKSSKDDSTCVGKYDLHVYVNTFIQVINDIYGVIVFRSIMYICDIKKCDDMRWE